MEFGYLTPDFKLDRGVPGRQSSLAPCGACCFLYGNTFNFSIEHGHFFS